jgi:hypothetical protein
MAVTIALIALLAKADSAVQLHPAATSAGTCRRVLTHEPQSVRVACDRAGLDDVLSMLNIIDINLKWRLTETHEACRCFITDQFHPGDRSETLEFLKDWGIEASLDEASNEVRLRAITPCQNFPDDTPDNTCRYEHLPSRGDIVECTEVALDEIVEAVNRRSEWKLILPDVSPKAWLPFGGRLHANAEELAGLLLRCGFTLQRQYDQKKILVTFAPSSAHE